jgi:hypothetical protein
MKTISLITTLAISTSAFGVGVGSLSCVLYDLPTDQILVEKTVQLSETEVATLEIEFLGVQAALVDRPVSQHTREQTIVATSFTDGEQRRDQKIIFYPTSLSPQKLPWVSTELPGAGDTIQFYCTYQN